MASVVQLCNMALSHIGSEARVASINPPDGSVEAGHCTTFYDQARTEMIEPGAWPFTLARASLAQVTNASPTWLFAHALPSDCLRPLRVLKSGATSDADSANFEREGEVLYTNEENPTLVYVRDVTDTTKFSPSFTAALGYLLAAYVAGPIIKGNDGIRIGDAMRQRAMSLAEVSATAAANATSTEHILTSSIVAVRA